MENATCSGSADNFTSLALHFCYVVEFIENKQVELKNARLEADAYYFEQILDVHDVK